MSKQDEIMTPEEMQRWKDLREWEIECIAEANAREHAKMLRARHEENLRDWFAGQALEGLTTKNAFAYDSVAAAKTAYQMADAMLAAREAGDE